MGLAPSSTAIHVHLSGVLMLGALALAYCLFVLIKPTHKCWCEPGRHRAQHKRCHGTGRVYYPGAATVHRFVWSVLLRRLMEARRDSDDS